MALKTAEKELSILKGIATENEISQLKKSLDTAFGLHKRVTRYISCKLHI